MTSFVLTLLFSSIVLLPGFAATGFGADDCAPVDLRAPGGPLHQVFPMEQRGQGLCQSYTAAQWADAFHRKKGVNKNGFISSPITLAVETAAGHWQKRAFSNFIRGGGSGYVCNTLRELKTHGACDDRLVIDRTDRWTELDSMSRLDAALLRALELFETIRAAEWELDTTVNPDALIADRVKEARAIRDEALNAVCETARTGVGVSKEFLAPLASILENIGKQNSMEFIEKFVLNQCSQPEHREDFSDLPDCADEAIFFNVEKAKREISQRLNERAPLPIPISYCSNVLRKGKSFSLKKRSVLSMRILGVDEDECGTHASLVIGRRKTDRCQLLVRNSWGPGCQEYSRDWDCESGDVWVDADLLMRNMTRITTFK